MRNLLIVLMFFIAMGAVVVAFRESGSGNQSSEQSAQSSDQSAQGDSATENALQVSAIKLFIDYQRNEVSADNVYKGRSLVVTGVVSGINKDIFDKIYVKLATPNEFMNVQAHLSEGNESKAASLQVGQPITVVCVGVGMMIGSPMLDKCSFANKPAESQSVNNSPLWPNGQQLPSGNSSESSPQAAQTEPTPQQEAEPNADGIYKVGGSVSMPIVTYQVEPEMPEQARMAKVGAKVLVNLDVDANGNPINIHVQQVILINANGNASSGPLSGAPADNLGFNEKAVETVKQYRFTPAKLNGVGVPVELNVEVTFQIF